MCLENELGPDPIFAFADRGAPTSGSNKVADATGKGTSSRDVLGVAGKQHQTTLFREAPAVATRRTTRNNCDAANEDPDVFTVR